MPTLPSGLRLALSRDALFDHGGNWFACPADHFWYWMPDPELGPPPFDLGSEVLQVAQHAEVPSDRDAAKRFIRVLEFMDDGILGWRGEWLASFPSFTALDDNDLQAWKEWLALPITVSFIDETIERCKYLAEVSARAQGYAVVTESIPGREEGWRPMVHEPRRRE